MAILSNLYSEKEIKTVNGVDYSLTDSVKNLWQPNSDIDKSIVYTKCSADSLKKASIDIATGKNINVLFKKSYTTYPQEFVFNLVYSPEYEIQNANIGYCLTYGQSSDFWNGFNPDKQTSFGSGGNTQFLRDFKIKNIVFSVNIKGYNVTDFNNIFTDVPENIQIPLDDLIKNPENYLISGITFSNPVIFKKTETNTYEKTTNSNIKIAVINMTDKSTGINMVERICRNESLTSSSPLNISVRSTSIDGNIGVTGGSYETLYYDLSKWYSCDDVKDFDIDFPEIDLTQYKETKEFDLGYFELSNNTNSVIYGKKSVMIEYTASTDTSRINNALVKLYRLLKGEFVVNLLAGAGVYMKDFSYNIPDNINPENLYASPNIYLGKMDKNGLTTGEFISGKDLLTYDGWNKDGSTINPNFNPNIATNNDDSETDMEIGSLYSASGMVRYYNVTSENLQMLSKLMSNADVVGTKNLLPNLISLKAFPISFGRLGRGTVKTIEIGGVEMTDNIAGTATGITVDSTYSFLECCDTTVQGKYGNISDPHFLDFSPYTQVELILPLAGSIVLPDNAMYKPLNVVYVYDIVNGSAICVVKSNGTVISTIPCTLSQDVPFSAINVGAKTSAMISNITNVAQNIATLGVSVGTGNLVGGISSGIGTVGSISQTVMSNNQNYIEKFGRNGDMCDFGLVKKAYIKYTRPIDIIPENFGRTNGYLCNVTKKLSDCSGFTICENPEINCSCTENEKQRIKQLLETGIYI